MSAEVILSGIGLAGILLSALMSSYGYLYRAKAEQKRNSRKVLYTLLEIRFSIMRSLISPIDATTKYIEYLIERFAKIGIVLYENDFPKELRINIQEHLTDVINSSIKNIEIELKVEYEQALSLMAAENPVLAYRLRGKEVIEKILGHTNSCLVQMEDYISSYEADKWLKDVFVKTSAEVKEQVANQVVKTLNSDVSNLSKVCGFSDHKSAMKAIKVESSVSQLLDFEELNTFFERYIKNIQDAARKKHQAEA